MKKIIFTLFLLCILAAGVFGQQYDNESDFTVEVIDNGRAVRITAYNGNKTAIRIPPQIRNLPVTEIGDRAFNEKGISSITIPNSVTSIGNLAFRRNNLTNINIPNSVINIGGVAFAFNQLTSVTIPNNVTSINALAFANNQLTNVSIPNGVTSIENNAFNNNKITSVTIPNSITSIGSRAFANNPLTCIILPANVTIDNKTFDDGIAELYISKGRKAFHYENGFAANLVLPTNNPKQADLMFGAAVYQEIQILRFLADTAAVNRHEAVLKFITDRGNATRAEIETYYRNGIRALVSAVVDEEFNKVSFLVRINPQMAYNCILIRSGNNQYLLSYESYFGTDTKSKKELTITSTEALPTSLRNSGDFPQAAIDTVRAQAALIPAVARPRELEITKTTVTNFFLTPNANTYKALTDLYSVYALAGAQSHLRPSFFGTISSLSGDLAMRMLGM